MLITIVKAKFIQKLEVLKMYDTEKFRDPNYVPDTWREFYFRELWEFWQSIKPYECDVCGRAYWSGRSAFKCCKERIKNDYNLYLRTRPHRPLERDCPYCKGEPGHYTCHVCEGRGKTFLPR